MSCGKMKTFITQSMRKTLDDRGHMFGTKFLSESGLCIREHEIVVLLYNKVGNIPCTRGICSRELSSSVTGQRTVPITVFLPYILIHPEQVFGNIWTCKYIGIIVVFI